MPKENIHTGDSLRNSLKEIQENNLTTFLNDNKEEIALILENSNEFKKTFLSLDEKKQSLFLENLNVIPFKFTGNYAYQTKQAFSYFNDKEKNNHLGETESFSGVIRTIFSLNNEDAIKNTLKEFNKSLFKRSIVNSLQSLDALKILKENMILITKFGNYVANYESKNKDEKINHSLENFLVDSIKSCLLDIDKIKTTPVERQGKEIKKDIQQLAHKHFSHRHLGRRVLADILQIITGTFIFLMPFRAITGKSALFSKAKTARQESVEEITNNTISAKPA